MTPTIVAPLVRNAIRVAVGYLLADPELAEILISDDQLVQIMAAGILALVEGIWLHARKRGWAT